MADYDNRVLRGQAGTADVDAGLRSYMLRVYNYMLVGLVLTGATAYLVADVPAIRELFFAFDPTTGRMGMTILGWIALFAPLGMVLLLSFRLNKMSLGSAQITFWLYAAIMGIGLAPVVLAYTGASIAQTFFITAGTFGAMSLWGYTTRTDLTGFGSFLFMGLIGIIIASVVNMFLMSSAMDWVISVIGVLIFTGLTAYDTQYGSRTPTPRATTSPPRQEGDLRRAEAVSRLHQPVPVHPAAVRQPPLRRDDTASERPRWRHRGLFVWEPKRSPPSSGPCRTPRSTWARSWPRLRMSPVAAITAYMPWRPRSLGRFSTRNSGTSEVRRKIENTAASPWKSMA